MLVFSNHHPEKKQGSLVNTKQLDTRQIETTLKFGVPCNSTLKTVGTG